MNRDKLHIIDLTHTFHTGMTVYPGTGSPEIRTPCTVKKNGFKESELRFFTHTGTHLDCPAHIFQKGKTITDFAPGKFFGRACVIDCRHLIDKGHIDERILDNKTIEDVDFVLFHTGWSEYWNSDRYFSEFPSIGKQLANKLLKLPLKGIGVDAISVEPINSTKLEIHHILLGHGLIIIENLTNLEVLAGKSFLFSCLPLKLFKGDGSPVRAVAILNAL